MWLTIVLERHLLPGSNLKIRFNALWLGFAFEQRQHTTSWREFLWKNFYSARISSCRDCYQDFASQQDSRWDPGEEFFLGGIPARTDFSAGFLTRYAAGIFPGKHPTGKTGHFNRIPPVSTGNGGIPARSRYLFYKGKHRPVIHTVQASLLTSVAL